MSNVIEFTIKGIDKSSGPLKKVSKTLSSIAKVTSTATVALNGAGAAVFAMTKKFANAEDRAAKFAKRIGKTVEGLTAVEFAGERAGISIQQIDMSLQRVERRAAEAAKGMGEAQGALKELGINARSFTGLGLEDKMALLAKQLEGVDDAAQRTRIAFKLFDSEGVSMLQMLGDGEEAFRKVTAEARKFGAVISAQAAANAEKFQDSFTNMTSVIGGIFRGMSDELIPIFTNIMDRITNFFVNNREAFITFTKNVIQAFWTVYAVGERVFNGIAKTIHQLTTFEGFKTFVTNFKNAFENIFENALATFEAIGNFIIDTFKVAFDSVVALGEWAWLNIKAAFTDAEGPDLAEFLFERLPDATAQAREHLDQSTSEMVDSVSTTFQAIGTNMADVLNISMDGLDERVANLTSSFKTFGEIAEETNTLVEESTLSLQERITEMWTDFMEQQGTSFEFMTETLFNTMQTAIDEISNGIAGVMVDGGNLLNVIKSVAKGVLKELIAMFIKLGVQRIATAVLTKGANVSEASTGAAKSIGLTFSNTMASWSGAPWPISLGAPAAAAAMAATAAAGFSAGAATGAGLGAGIAAAAHGGMGYVPSEATYLLDKGERVLSPNQNQDFTDFINSGTNGLVVQSLVIHILENATNAESILNMDPKEIKEIVADKIITALDELSGDGIRPNYVGAA